MANEDTLARVARADEELARLELAKQEERAFVVSYLADVSSGGGTITVQLRNPADSGFDVDVVQSVFSSQFAGQFAIYDTFDSAPANGTELTVDNLLLDSGGTNGPTQGGVVTTHSVEFTPSGTPHLRTVLPSGGVGGGSTGGSLLGSEPLIEPGREIVLELENDSNNTNPGSIGVVYIEREREEGE